MFWFSLNSRKKYLLNREWTTMIELMAVLAIMWMGIAAMLATIGWGIDYAHDTEDNIKAINLAREWIEWTINIRDTNWLRFSSDVKNCWRILNYQWSCIGSLVSQTNNPLYMSSGSYILYSQNGLWFLSGTSSPNFSSNWSGYKTNFQTYFDTGGYFTQTGWSSWWALCTSKTGTGCTTTFTREIQVAEINTGTLQISSIVRWIEKRPRQVILNSTVTNWKSNF